MTVNMYQLVLKEFRLILSDLHALFVLFVMPTTFLVIMSLAIPSESGHYSKPVNVLVYTDTDTDTDTLLFVHLLQNEQGIDAVDFTHIQNNRDTYLILGEDFRNYVNGSGEGGTSISVVFPPEFGFQLREIIKAKILKAATMVKLKNTMLGFGFVFMSGDAENLANEIMSTSNGIDIIEEENSSHRIPNAVEQSMPAWLIFGMYFIVIPLSNSLVREKASNTLARIKSIGVNPSIVLLHKIVPYAIINQIQFMILITTAIVIVPYLGGDVLKLEGSYLSYFWMSVVTSISAIGLGLLIAVLSESTEQAIVLGGGINLILAAMGGIMIPEHVMADRLNMLVQISPMNWSLNGFHELILYKVVGDELIINKIKLILFGIVCFSSALLIFYRKYRKLTWN